MQILLFISFLDLLDIFHQFQFFNKKFIQID